MIDHNTVGSRRIVQLDGLRAIAVLMVFVHHSFKSQLFWTGVDLFFILSGFLITGILLDQRQNKFWGGYLGPFYGRRARRLLPPYLLFLVFTSVFFGIGWLRRWYVFLFLMNTEPFRSMATDYSIGILWSLAVEEQFYLLWPIAVYFLDEVALAWLAGGLVVAAPILRGLVTAYYSGHFTIYTGTPFRMDLLAAGALIALLWRRQHVVAERVAAYGPWIACLAIIPLIWLTRYPWFRLSAGTTLTNVWVLEFSLVGLVGVVLWALSGRWVGFLKLKPLTYIGRISYSFYLVHLSMIVIVRRHTHHFVMSAAIALALTFMYAALSWHFLERPLLERGKRKSPKFPNNHPRPQPL